MITTGKRAALAWASAQLARSGVAEPAREARRLWALAWGIGDPAAVEGGAVPGWVRRRYRLLVAARARRVPLALLEGRVGFLDFEVEVSPGVFIPRPETEELAERAIAELAKCPRPLFLDLGTGAGVLALALARACPHARGVAVDVSPRALRCAWRNARRLGVHGRVEFRRSDWFSAVPERFSLVVANPPYVRRGEMRFLAPEIRRYEPRRALDGGPDGLAAIRTILAEAPRHLDPGGVLLMEIGADQGPAVQELARAVGFTEARVEKDLAGKERFFLGRCG